MNFAIPEVTEIPNWNFDRFELASLLDLIHEMLKDFVELAGKKGRFMQYRYQRSHSYQQILAREGLAPRNSVTHLAFIYFIR